MGYKVDAQAVGEIIYAATGMTERFGGEFVAIMIDTKKQTVKRSALWYKEFIESTRKEIDQHKKRIGA